MPWAGSEDSAAPSQPNKPTGRQIRATLQLLVNRHIFRDSEAGKKKTTISQRLTIDAGPISIESRRVTCSNSISQFAHR